jgi:3-phosphoshikimate 1-carboxyvinyltransferase
MPTTRLVVNPVRGGLRGSVPVPSDKSISHRALIFAALASGHSDLRGFSYGEDNVATLNAFRNMGLVIDDDGQGLVRVQGQGLNGLSAPKTPIDCGNSGTTMRLLAGLLSGQRFASQLTGDASLVRRPMGRIVIPLRARGAILNGAPHPSKPNELTPPLEVGPLPDGKRLSPLEYQLPMSSAQVKSCLLLSGLYASGPTTLAEPIVSRDHTERMMEALALPIRTVGSIVSLHPPADPHAIKPFSIDLPGDLSAAAFLLTAAAIVPDSQITTRHTGLNPTRTGIIDVIRMLGGQLATSAQGETLNEPYGEITVATSRLRGGVVSGELSVRSIDEIPILCALAARARGTTEFCDVGELRVKESDRIALMVRLLRAFGVEASEREDGLAVEGRPTGPLCAARIESGGDHRIAMTAAVLGLLADGQTIVDDVDCIATSFPRFVGTLRALGAEIEVLT